jgi:hypothetical protein
MTKTKVAGVALLAMGALILLGVPAFASDPVNHPVAFGISAPLGQLAKLPQAPVWGLHEANPARRTPKPTVNGRVVDTVEQNSLQPTAHYTIGDNFLGVGNGYPNYTVPDAPPDTTMAVGDTQIIQWVNVSYIICNKTSPYNCSAAIDGNALWASGIPGTLCANNNDGDPIAQWDVAAHRWLLAQNVFSSPYAVCVAVSQTADANGAWYVWQFSVPGNGFPDYPKWGVWPTDYMQANNDFGPGGGGFIGSQLCVYNRAKMLAGNPSAEQICHLYGIDPNYQDGLLPADVDSIVAPPANEDHFAMGSVGDIDNSHLSLYAAHINNLNDWSQGATFLGDADSILIPIATFNPACGTYGGACVPQKGVPDLVDSLGGGRLMYRFAYRADHPSANVTSTPPLPAPAQHWFATFDVNASLNQIGVRWMEITAPLRRVDPTALNVFQQGTYAPDGTWRWMASMASDKKGDILVGYSKSCGDNCPGGTPTYPSIFIAGRQVNDALGLGQLEDELQVVAGTGSQPDTSNRWGDYSTMRIDPNDQCTFWYTTEYYMVTQRFDWSTKINSAKFSNCQ